MPRAGTQATPASADASLDDRTSNSDGSARSGRNDDVQGKRHAPRVHSELALDAYGPLHAGVVVMRVRADEWITRHLVARAEGGTKGSRAAPTNASREREEEVRARSRRIFRVLKQPDTSAKARRPGRELQ